MKSQKVGIYSNLTGYQDLIAKYIQKTELTADGSRIECNFDLLYNSILTVNYRTFDTVILAGITAHPAAVSLVLQRQTEAARAYAVVDRQHSLDGPASSAGDLVDIVKAVAAIQNSVTATTTDSPTSAAAPPPEDWPVVQNNAVLVSGVNPINLIMNGSNSRIILLHSNSYPLETLGLSSRPSRYHRRKVMRVKSQLCYRSQGGASPVLSQCSKNTASRMLTIPNSAPYYRALLGGKSKVTTNALLLL